MSRIINRPALLALIASAYNVHASRRVVSGELPVSTKFMRPADAGTLTNEQAVILLRAYVEYARDPSNRSLFTVADVETAIAHLGG